MQFKIFVYTCPAVNKIRYRYYFKFRFHGQYIRLRKQGFETESEARADLEKNYYGIIHDFIPVPEKQRSRGRNSQTKAHTFREIVQIIHEKCWSTKLKVSTITAYLGKLEKYIYPVIGEKVFTKITEKDINYIYEGCDCRLTHITTPLLSIIKYANSLKIDVPAIPDRVWKFDVAVYREEYLTAEEVLIVMKEANPEIKHIIAFLIYSGMRIGEVLGLDWKDVDINKKEITIRRQWSKHAKAYTTTKSGKIRIIPIDDNIINILKSYAKTLGSEWILSGIIFNIKQYKVNNETIRLREFINKKIVVHTYRHTAGSLMVQAGVPTEKIAKILGQTNQEITKRYCHHSTNSLRSAIAVLPDLSI